MPVDQYIGGIEHAVLHLLYARFYTKVLRDLGLVKVDEPFQALLSQGMVIKDGAKMSKSKGNVVDPDDLIRTFGADTARLFSLFAAPPEKDLDWNDHGVEGASRFLNRVWRFVLQHAEEVRSALSVYVGGGETAPPTTPPARAGATTRPSALRVGRGEAPPPTTPPDRAGATTRPSNSHATLGSARGVGVVTTTEGKAFRRTIHETIARVTEDIERDFHFNTAISAIMELVNALYAFEMGARDRMPAGERAVLLREAVETMLLLLGPFSPHVTEELWAHLGHTESLFKQPWPTPDPGALTRQEVTVVLQVDGKVRSRLTVEVDAAEARVQTLALADARVRPWLDGRTIERVVVVPNRLVNVVTRS
jgi:leucyl-tRNA synthetase